MGLIAEGQSHNVLVFTATGDTCITDNKTIFSVEGYNA